MSAAACAMCVAVTPSARGACASACGDVGAGGAAAVVDVLVDALVDAGESDDAAQDSEDRDPVDAADVGVQPAGAGGRNVDAGVDADVDASISASVESWRAELMILCWLPGIDGTVGVGGETASAHESFLDIVDSSDSLFGYCGRVEAGQGAWSVFLDGLYDRATDENAVNPIGLADLEVTFEETLLDFGAMYRLIGSHDGRETSVDVYAGARYTALEVEFESASLPSVSDDRDWVDPIVGARLGLPLDALLGGPFRLAVNGDVGGFGVSSDLTWSATAFVAYDFDAWDTPASVFVGYRAVGWDYSDGTGAAAFTWDIVQHGVLFGFAVRF
ncbi:MAG: hypothetical protein LW806_08440 [Planctomycetaceae bacterium]|nr:hypothetical protein [Planctomycetaceae bacterium]